MTDLQKRTGDWCEQHYPGEDVQQKLQNVAEEFAELAIELGGDIDKIVEAFRASADRPRIGTIEAAKGEVGDLQLTVFDLARLIEVDALDCLIEKLQSLSARTPEESRARAERKASMGIPQTL